MTKTPVAHITPLSDLNYKELVNQYSRAYQRCLYFLDMDYVQKYSESLMLCRNLFEEIDLRQRLDDRSTDTTQMSLFE